MIFWAPIKEEDAAQGFSGYTKATQLPIFTRPLNLPQVFLNGCLRPSSLTPDPKGVGSVADPEGMGPPYCLFVSLPTLSSRCGHVACWQILRRQDQAN